MVPAWMNLLGTFHWALHYTCSWSPNPQDYRGRQDDDQPQSQTFGGRQAISLITTHHAKKFFFRTYFSTAARDRSHCEVVILSTDQPTSSLNEEQAASSPPSSPCRRRHYEEGINSCIQDNLLLPQFLRAICWQVSEQSPGRRQRAKTTGEYLVVVGWFTTLSSSFYLSAWSGLSWTPPRSSGTQATSPRASCLGAGSTWQRRWHRVGKNAHFTSGWHHQKVRE